MSINQTVERLADLTFNLLVRCQEKKAWLAEEHGLFQSEFTRFGVLRREIKNRPQKSLDNYKNEFDPLHQYHLFSFINKSYYRISYYSILNISLIVP